MSDRESLHADADQDAEGSEIAVIAMAGRFPGAGSVEELWRNLRDGVESVRRLTIEELEAWGADPELVRDPSFVPAHGAADDVDRFDAAFFGFNPREAEILDPQQRFFLEVCWEALERAGYDSERYPGAVGVFAGSHANFYLQRNIHRNLRVLASVGHYQAILANLPDSLATRASYKLNLRGPSFAVQCACSTSLVAIHMACQSLLAGECDMALAGGATIIVPQGRGYLYQEGLILSPDGHCRPFDARAKGIVTGDGVAVVMLKRLADAQRDRDPIAAVILGSAINNDGSHKVGYTAPGLEGQRLAIEEAQEVAGVDPESIGYVEAHGTATSVGDPLEVTALTHAFRARTDLTQFCALGSVKSNFGHLDAAAGVTGFIKTVMGLQHRQIPPSLHFETPNPDIDFASSPFYVNTRLRDWEPRQGTRRAGVSAFGIGGTNAHIVVEEAPEPTPSTPSPRPRQLVLLSGRTESALDAMSARLAAHLRENPSLDLADVAYTLQVGRRQLAQRRAVVGASGAEIAAALEGGAPKRVLEGRAGKQERSLTFLFPGQGAQYVGMGEGLYRTEPVFREQVDRAAEALRPHLGLDLREVLYPEAGANDEAAERLRQTAMAQPALFVVEHALARLWMDWGLTPNALIGHSVGEYTAACLAGVMSLDDALTLVAARGRLMQSLPPGDMLSVPLPVAEVEPLLGPGLAVGAVNAPSLCVVSGPAEAVAALRRTLVARGVEGRILETSHAFHSPMMDPILGPFSRLVAGVELSEPRIPFVSTVTGTWISAAEATSVAHWVANVRQAVRFSDGAATLLADGADRAFLEVGPGTTLGSLLRLQPERQAAQPVVASLRHPLETEADEEVALKALGRLWTAGLAVDWHSFHAREERRRVILPTYPFERKSYWVMPKDGTDNTIVLQSKLQRQAQAGGGQARRTRAGGAADWYYVPGWKSSPLPRPASDPEASRAPCLVFADATGVGDVLVRRLRERGHPTAVVRPGAAFRRLGADEYELEPAAAEGYGELVRALLAAGGAPELVAHLWSVGTPPGDDEIGRARRAQELGLFSLLYLARALVTAGRRVRLRAVSSDLQAVTGDDVLHPEKATLIGACRVIPQELSLVGCALVDIQAPRPDSGDATALGERVLAELLTDTSDLMIAHRGLQRWVEDFQEISLEHPASPPRLRPRGVYLITGGVGGVGMTLAEHLAETVEARLVLTGRSPLPAPAEWDRWLHEHGPDDPTSRKIAKIRGLEAMGAEVLALSADVCDADQMSAVVDAGRRRFGAYHGVIHAAGVASDHPIAGISPAQAAGVLDPKLDGTLLLDRLLAGSRLDFFVLMSSMSSLVGGLAQVDYAAANAFLDNFAKSRQGRGAGLTVAVNWDAWGEVGMAARYADEKGLDRRANWIEPKDGREALTRILGDSLPQVIVSKRDFFNVRAQFLDLMRVGTAPAAQEERAPGAEPEAGVELASDFAAPETETQKVLAQIWKDLLAVERVGVEDDFFELGGHSLLGTQVVSLVRERLGVELVLRDVLGAPTIRELAEAVEALRGGAAEGEPVAVAAGPDAGLAAALTRAPDEALSLESIKGRTEQQAAARRQRELNRLKRGS